MNHEKNGEITITLTVGENQLIVFSVVGKYSINWGDDRTNEENSRVTGADNNVQTDTFTCQHEYKIAGSYTIHLVGEINEFVIKHIPLEYIFFKNCTCLDSIHVGDCGLQKLDIVNARNLVFLNCPCNNLKRLKLTSKSLIVLNCVCNNLTNLDLKSCNNLYRLECSCNNLICISLNSPKFRNFDCCCNNLSAEELEKLFVEITKYGNVGEINYALNPGTANANPRALNHWEINNKITERIVKRVLDEKNSSLFNQMF